MSKKWEPHKEEILRLYMVENLTLDQVMGHMFQVYGFDQKKPHYEYRLKLWGARKNIKREVLEFISHQERKREKSQDLNRGFYVVNGMLLAESRIDRARQRHNFDVSLARRYGRAASPQLPPGHIIHRAGVAVPAIEINWPESLPWLRFEERFNIVAPQSSKIIQILARAMSRCGLMSGMDSSETDLARAIFAAPHETQPNAASLAGILPCIPNRSQSSTVDISVSNPNDIVTKILKGFLFQTSNKLQGWSKYEHLRWGKELLSLFHELDEANPTVLSHLANAEDPTSEAVIESLYKAAVTYGATALVSRLLEAGSDANALLWISWQFQHSSVRGKADLRFDGGLRPMTALQFAASTCNIQLATTLINAGAKADLGRPTPLQILCLFPEVGRSDVLRFADLLVSNGARLNTVARGWTSPLEGAVIRKNRSLVYFLLQCGAIDVLHRWEDCRHNLCYNLLEIGDQDFLIPGWKTTFAPTSALQSAVMLGDDCIAKALASSIADQENGATELLEHSLITACVAGDPDLARVILKHLDLQLEDNEGLINSAFFATAWDMNCRVAQLLLEHQAVRRKLQKSCLPIFQAAALHGNANLVMLLCSNEFDMNSGSSLRFELQHKKQFHNQPYPELYTILSTPMGCAIWMSHKDVIELFFELGAEVPHVDLMTAIRSRSSELITQVLNSCDDINNNWDGQSALDLAIRERIGLTMIRKLIDAGATPHGHELVDAVCSNDQEVVNFFLSGRDILVTNSRSEKVLEAACCMGNLGVVHYYFAHGGVYNSSALLMAVSKAVKTHDYRIVECMVVNRPSGPVDNFEVTALVLSIRMDDTTLLEMFIHDDFRPSTELSIYCGSIWEPPGPRAVIEAGIYPLHYEDLETDLHNAGQRHCLKHRYQCQGRFSPLLIAAVKTQERIVTKLLAHGYLLDPLLVDVVYKSSSIGQRIQDVVKSAYVLQTPNVADQDWHRDIIFMALDSGVDLGIIQQHLAKLSPLEAGDFSSTLLYCAARSGSCNHVRAVLEAGATADTWKGPRASRAFFAAAEMGFPEIISLLLDHGADINYDAHETFGSVLFYGNFNMAVFLIDHGLDINAPVTIGRRQTFLESAAYFGVIDLVEMLLSRGVDIQGRARIHFVRSVTMATQNCHYATAKLLKERGKWTDEDDELAETPQGRDREVCCLGCLYNDLTLAGCIRRKTYEDTSGTAAFSRREKGAISSPTSYEGVDEQSTLDEMDPVVNDMSMLDIELETMDYEQTNQITEWSFTSYGPQDRALDMMVEGFLDEGFLLEDSIIP